MASMSWFFENGGSPPRSTTDVRREIRAQIEREEQEKVERRRVESAELRADVNSPETRIRAWERLHGLRLPRDANHPVLDVIAVATRLTLEQVRDEQAARAARTTIGFASTAPSVEST